MVIKPTSLFLIISFFSLQSMQESLHNEKITNDLIQKLIESYQKEHQEQFDIDEYAKEVKSHDSYFVQRKMDIDALNKLIEKFKEENNSEMVEALNQKVGLYRDLYKMTRGHLMFQ